MPTVSRKRKNPALPVINPRPVTVGNEAQLRQPLPPARALPAINATPAPDVPISAPPSYPRTFVGSETTAPSGTMEDLLARREANLQAIDRYPASKITHTGEGYEIAPPLPPGQHPSRFKSFLKGMGVGALYGLPGGPGAAAGGAIAGGIANAVNPDLVPTWQKDQVVKDAESRIGTQLGIEAKQAGISNVNAQAVLRTAQARNAIRFPNVTTKPLELPNGGPTVQMEPRVGADGNVVWEPSQTTGGGLVTSKAAVPQYDVEVGGQHLKLAGPQAATALGARDRGELSEREFQYRQNKDDADRRIEQAKAAAEAGSIDEAINLTQGAAGIYRTNANTAADEVRRLQDEIGSHGDAVDPTSGVSYLDSPEGQVLVNRLKAAQQRADDFDKAATDAEQSLPGLIQKQGGARGRAKAYSTPKASPSKSGLFNKPE